ncbi:dipeptidase 1 [Bactrocera neohumeralis]|uniref:dipeptidase 1 n=1 Tax=Bactrocera tryoni TaxID=59916 RepID=UPI001A9622B5|nr:dipeptidase 1 [Bactrocera tryoni]XP_050341318.1 dipeptidase 1 [Bactrocera neohumeralis]
MNPVPNREYIEVCAAAIHHHQQHPYPQHQHQHHQHHQQHQAVALNTLLSNAPPPPPPTVQLPHPHELKAPPHEHQPHCKQQCFVFTEIADIELPPEITKLGGEKLKNGAIAAAAYKMSACSDSGSEPSRSSRNRRLIVVLGIMLVCIAMAGGIPLALQLRSSSLLEARLAFIRRLLTESPLIEGSSWQPPMRDAVNRTSGGLLNEVRRNHVGAVFWPISVPCGAQYLDAVQLALEGIDEARRITANTDALHIVLSADEMEQTHIRGEVAVMLGLGGGHTLGASLAVLRSMYLLGARFVSITSLECTTPWAAACIRSHDYLFEENATHSINEFGKTVLYEMNRLGMLIEISQLSEAAMVTALHTAKAPVLLLNAVPISLCNSSSVASIPDRVLSLLSDNGGVIMLNLERCDERRFSVREAINAINYVRKVAGVDHIGLGGAPKSYAFLLAELARDRVWGNAAIKKLIGGNVVRILREVETLKNRLPLYEDWIPRELVESTSYCRYPET